MKILSSEELPCGCVVGTAIMNGEKTFFMKACSAGENCKYVRYTMEEGQRQEKKISKVYPGLQ